MEKTITVSGGTLTLSPLNLGQIRALEQTLREVASTEKPGIPSMMAFVPHIHAAVAVKHPDLTIERLEAMLTIHDLGPAQTALLEVSGLKVEEVGEAEPVQA